MKKIVTIIGLTAFLSGCGQQSSNTSQQSTDANALARQIQDLKVEIALLKKQQLITAENVENLSSVGGIVWTNMETDETNLGTLWTNVETLWTNAFQNMSVRIVPDDKRYELLKTTFGVFFVSTESVKPYLDGYKINLLIGNLTGAVFHESSIICSTYDSTNSSGTSQTKTFEITGDLIPGTWNRITFVLTPATMDEVRNATVSLRLGDVHLSNPQPAMGSD